MTTTDTVTIARQDLIDYLELIEGRAKAREQDAQTHILAGRDVRAAYDTGITTGYRGAARALRFCLGDIS